MVHTNEYNATCISCYALHKLTPNFVWSVATENVQIINIYTAHFGILMVTMSTNMVGVSRDPITGNMLPSMEGGGDQSCFRYLHALTGMCSTLKHGWHTSFYKQRLVCN